MCYLNIFINNVDNRKMYLAREYQIIICMSWKLECTEKITVADREYN